MKGYNRKNTQLRVGVLRCGENSEQALDGGIDELHEMLNVEVDVINHSAESNKIF